MKHLLILIIGFSFLYQNVMSQCTPDAGMDDMACGLTYTLQGTISQTGSAVAWTTSYPGVIFSNPNQLTTEVFVPSFAGSSLSIAFVFTESNGSIPCTNSDTVVITFQKLAHAEAGTIQLVCGMTTQLSADTIGTGIINGYWTSSVPGILITPTGMDPIAWNPLVDASLLLPGFFINSQREVYFYWHAQNNSGCTSIDSVKITFYEIPIANAGLDTSICGKSYDMIGNWSIVNPFGVWNNSPMGPGTANFNPINLPNAFVSVTDYGDYYFVWKEMNQGNTNCFDRDTVLIHFLTVPTPDAGMDFSVCGSWAQITAIPSTQGGHWTSPPGIAYFDGLYGNYDLSYQDSCTSFIRYPSENDTVTMYWNEFNGFCYGYDSVNVYFSSIQPAIPLVDPADSIQCGNHTSLLNAQWPIYGYGYWIDTVMNTSFSPSANSSSPIATISQYGDHTFYWITINSNCTDTSSAVNISFLPSPNPYAGPDQTVCGGWAHLTATPDVSGGRWFTAANVTYYDTINGIQLPFGYDSLDVWINYPWFNTVNMFWGETMGFCYYQDTVKITFQDCGFAGPDAITCGQSYTFDVFPNYGSGSIFQWISLTGPVLFDDETLMNSSVTLPAFSDTAQTYVFVLEEINNSASFSAMDTIEITFFSGCNLISGKVFFDNNLNGIFDTGDNGAIIIVRAGNEYAITDSLGDYNIIVNAGNFTIEAPNLSTGYNVFPTIHTANFSGSNAIDSINNFAITLSTDTNLSVNGTISNVRPGFNCNHSIACRNFGLYTINGSIRLYIDPQLQFISSSITPSSINGNLLEWNNQSLLPNQYFYTNIITSVPSSIPIGTAVLDSVFVYPIIGDIEPANNHFIFGRSVSGSYDPNEKIVSPEDGLTPDQLNSGERLYYAIHFQNTGTDTAFNVVVTDNISQNLNLGSFEITGYSHPVSMQIVDQRKVIFNFSNILLPDSNTNEPLSHGFVSYSLKPLSSLVEGSQIDNTANIYFDYNEPVVTNTVTSLILNPFDIEETAIYKDPLNVFPNPFSEECTINYSLSNSSNVILEVYDVVGNKIKTIYNDFQHCGNYKYEIKSDNLNGNQIYIIRLVINNEQYISKVLKL